MSYAMAALNLGAKSPAFMGLLRRGTKPCPPPIVLSALKLRLISSCSLGIILLLAYHTSSLLCRLCLTSTGAVPQIYAAGWEPYLVWFTRFQEKPALALPHLRWPPLLPR